MSVQLLLILVLILMLIRRESPDAACDYTVRIPALTLVHNSYKVFALIITLSNQGNEGIALGWI